MTQLWWERYPERLEWEFEELRADGVPARRDEEAFAAGIARIVVEPTIDGVRHEFVVTFPDLYPYFRFEIQAHGLALPHHQHPFAKRLCTLGRATANWRIKDSVASMIREQVPRVLVAGQSQEKDAGGVREEQQGEPASDYYTYMANAMVLIDGSWQVDPAVTSGTFTFRYHSHNPGFGPLFVLRAVVTRVVSDAGVEMAAIDPRLAELYPEEGYGRWVRSNAPIPTNEPRAFFEALESADPNAKRARPARVQGGELFLRGVIFPEEHAHREKSDGWMFSVQLLGEQVKGNRRRAWQYLVRTGRAGADDLIARAPELRGLSEKSIAVFGLGCIGAPSALEFARAAVGSLCILDGDHVDPGTVLRWPVGLEAAGLQKADHIAAVIRGGHPYTDVHPINWTIGSARDTWVNTMNDVDVVDRMLADASLVYDATAEVGVQYFLSDVARQRGIPYVGVSGKQGGWGGYVVRVVPGKTEGCWMCFQHLLGDEIPLPPAAPTDFIQPAGCANPTFLATGFDMSQIAMHGVRKAIGILTDGAGDTRYPDDDWDVLVIALRDEQGRAIAPAAKGFHLRRHPDCAVCGAA